MSRLWRAVPDELRATPKDITSNPLYPDTAHRRRVLDRLAKPRCNRATRPFPALKLWAPCCNPVRSGAARCALHGGPSSVATA